MVGCDVYIGRQQYQGGWSLARSKWANPYVIGTPTPMTPGRGWLTDLLNRASREENEPQREPIRETQRETILARRLRGVTNYDAVVIDSSPAMNLLTYNALLYAEEIIVPVGMDLMAIIGARQTLNGVAEVKELWPDRRLDLLAVLPTFTSATNNNGSAFAGISVNTDWYNTALGLAMVFGRFLPIVLVLALAGSLAKQGHTPESAGTLPTDRPQFVGMVAGVTVILVSLTFLPMLALGPLAEGIH